DKVNEPHKILHKYIILNGLIFFGVCGVLLFQGVIPLFHTVYFYRGCRFSSVCICLSIFLALISTIKSERFAAVRSLYTLFICISSDLIWLCHNTEFYLI